MNLEYGPAPLDFLSLSNGIAKFEHAQVNGSNQEVSFALSCLEYLFPLLWMDSNLSTEEEIKTLLEEKKSKAAGEPWRIERIHNKGQALERVGLGRLAEYYNSFDSVISSTLKDELRLKGKDARLFRPQDVASYIEGATLFHHQNQHLTIPLVGPIFVRFQVPGQDIPMMFASLEQHNKEGFAADGSQWDAHFPLFCASIIAEFRIRCGLPRDRVERYYTQMYGGYTLCSNEILQLIGQPSGHFNTSVDNALCHIVLLSIHAFRLGMTVQQFIANLKFYCCGDDLVWTTTDHGFYPSEIEKTYNSFEVYLEFQSYQPLPIDDLIFVGVKRANKTVGSRTFKLFSLVSPRSFASLHVHKRKTLKNPLLKLAKFASLGILWFCDEERYTLVCELFRQELAHLIRKHKVCAADASVIGLMRAFSPDRLLKQYMHWEHKAKSEVNLVLQFGSSGNTSGDLNKPCRRLCGLSLGLEIPCSVLLQQELTGASRRCTRQIL